MVPWTALAGADAPATAADTWGIAGPTFLYLYWSAVLAAVVFALVLRARLTRTGGPVDPYAAPLTPTETAALFDDRRAVLAALAQLRGRHLIDSAGNPIRGAGSAEHATLDQLSRTIYSQLRTAKDRKITALSWAARGALETLRSSLAERGYLLGSDQRKLVRVSAIPLFALFALGLVRVFAGIANDHSVFLLIISMMLLFFAIPAIMRPPRLTRRGRGAVEEAKRRNGHLRPGNAPAYAAYGSDSAAVATALFGATVLWSLDPALAGATGTVATGGGSSDSSCSGGSSGSSCSGGSSCGGGGGGGCGGGGCGG